ncbi:1-acyl-sn-glycerol-3-phosphate acyltransferase [Candidatus Gracilibacteria bacterium]|nr:1-acyl-sn-glycerol-3-phosphate acyltransferase [Candidatus Gracilibacteria bacterium]
MKYVDVKEQMLLKNPKLRYLPSFIVNWIKRIVHEDEINEMINLCKHLQGLEFNNAILSHLGIKINVIGLEKIPLDGKYIFVSNHPLGGLDGIAFISAIGNRFKNISFPVNDILLSIKNFEPIFVGINKHGNQKRADVLLINQLYSDSNKQILFFPAGLVSRYINGEIIDPVWQKNFVKKAIEYKRSIVPVYIDGKNSFFFYLIAKIRKYFGLANIELFLLPNELFRQRNKTITLTIGDIIPFDNLNGNHQDIVEIIREEVYSLSKVK